MAAALTPRVRMMAICDGVRESKIEAGVFHLRGVRQGMTAPAFPFVPDKLCLFVLFSSPRVGEFPWYVRVVNERTNKAIFFAHVEARLRFGLDDAMCAQAGCRSVAPFRKKDVIQSKCGSFKNKTTMC